jgi:Rrf2 family protein
MYINMNTQNAILILNELKNRKDVLSVNEISKKHEVSEFFLQQIARKLRVEGYIVAIRGPGGGYLLKKKHVTLLELYELFASKKKKKMMENSAIESQLRTALNGITVLS